MQVARPRQYALTGFLVVALAIAAALALALVITSFRPNSDASRSTSVAPAANAFDQVAFMEANTIQIPYTAPHVRSSTDSLFWELNTIQTPYLASMPSSEAIAFWEINTMQIPYSAAARTLPGTIAEE